MNGKPRISFTFPLRWIDDPEDKKYLSQNLVRSIKKNGLRQVFQSSVNDPYYQQHGGGFMQSYAVILKYHAYQPVKIKLTAKQLETALMPVFGQARLSNYQTFFVQTSFDPGALPMMEMEIYY